MAVKAVKDKKKQVGIGIITEGDRYLFGEGTHYEIYKKLGAHMVDDEGQEDGRSSRHSEWKERHVLCSLGTSRRSCQRCR